MKALARLVVLVVLAPLAAGCAPGAPAHRAYLPAPAFAEAPPDPASAEAIAFAESQIGKDYCWGGTGPRCFDCSGLVQAAWAHAGIRLPRTTGAQADALAEVPIGAIRPGDVLWWSHGHVGLYVGGGAIVDAYHSGAGVVRRRAPVPDRVLRVAPGAARAWASRGR